MQKPPGVGSPARASAARLAALGPTQEGSVVAESGRVNAVIRISLARCATHSLSPLAGRAWVRGPFRGLRIIATPPHPDCFAIRPLPAREERCILSHMIAIARQRIDDR